jgi:hypothetical protein
MDLEKPLVLVVSLGIFLLVVFLDSYAFKVSLEHVTVLKVVVRGPFLVGTRFFEHFVKNAPTGGPRGFLRSTAATRSSAEASCLPCWFFFFLLFLFEPRLEPTGSSPLCFPLS